MVSGICRRRKSRPEPTAKRVTRANSARAAARMRSLRPVLLGMRAGRNLQAAPELGVMGPLRFRNNGGKQGKCTHTVGAHLRALKLMVRSHRQARSGHRAHGRARRCRWQRLAAPGTADASKKQFRDRDDAKTGSMILTAPAQGSRACKDAQAQDKKQARKQASKMRVGLEPRAPAPDTSTRSATDRMVSIAVALPAYGRLIWCTSRDRRCP